MVSSRERRRELNGIEAGIMFGSDFLPRFQCIYTCKCGNRGFRFVRLDALHTQCHECNKKIWLDYAVNEEFVYNELTKSEIPVRDADNNFFVATKMVSRRAGQRTNSH